MKRWPFVAQNTILNFHTKVIQRLSCSQFYACYSIAHSGPKRPLKRLNDAIKALNTENIYVGGHEHYTCVKLHCKDFQLIYTVTVMSLWRF